MKLNSKISLAILSLINVPALVYAVEPCGYDKGSGRIEPCNAGTTVDTVSKVIIEVTGWILGFAGAIAVLFIIWGGIQYMTAAGNEKQAESAKQTLTYAVIGLIVILLAYVIVGLVANVTKSVTN